MATNPEGPSPKEPGPQGPGGFLWNQPTIISLLYLGGFVTGVSALVGLVLAFSWKGDPRPPEDLWMDSHFRFLIRTFFIGLVWVLVAAVLSLASFFLLAWLFFPLVSIWFLVRAVKALLAAQKCAPIANIETWFV